MVFTLLETVYSAFDSIADRRNVFKVETIGDCCKLQQIGQNEKLCEQIET
jgi:hypothetical protein